MLREKCTWLSLVRTNDYMVLHKSKWDHKAKVQYLKKHGLARPKPKPGVQPKWSGKKSAAQKPVLLDDSDAEWDSDDDALIDHFFPEIGEQNLAVEHKRKIKRLIIATILERTEPQEEKEEPQEVDGIYLGERPEVAETAGADLDGTDDEFEWDIPDLETKLSEFVMGDLSKLRNRKLLTNTLLENLLEDYGIDSYSSTVKDTDYSKPRKTTAKALDRLTSTDLHGFRIGDSLGDSKKPSSIRTLSEEEQQEHLARAEKVARERLLSQIKSKFGEQKRAKVLEINNFNDTDERQMESLNLKLARTTMKPTLDSDLRDLLGFTDSNDTADTDDLDLLLKSAALADVGEKKTEKHAPKLSASKQDEAFLDDLLG